MQNNGMNSLKTIQQDLSVISKSGQNMKFRRVSQQSIPFDLFFSQDHVFKDAIIGCEKVNREVFRISDLGQKLVDIKENDQLEKSKHQQPKKLEVKMVANVQRTRSLHRPQSDNKSIKNHGRNLSRNKAFTATRFSNKQISSIHQIQRSNSVIAGQRTPSMHYKKNSATFHHRKNLTTDLTKDNTPHQERSPQKSTKKRVRLKTNSEVSLNGDFLEQRKYHECIPLEGFQIQEEDNFWENAYRLRKGQVPVWFEISKMWDKAEAAKKNNHKSSINGKEHKKVIFEGYDFNGQLIPSVHNAPKPKKVTQDNSEIQVNLLQENNIQNLQNYHQRQQRYARTVKKIKIKQQQYAAEPSSFLNNFQKVDWNPNIQYTKVEQIQDEVVTQSQKQVPSSMRKKHQSSYEPMSQEKKPQQYNAIEQEKKKIDHQVLMEEFQKIKYNQADFDCGLNQGKGFPFGFSKYVKVKKFQQKQKKSKSYNFHTHNYFSSPVQNTQVQIQSNIKLGTPQKKGDEKIRANKRLFKQVFNMSLKFIEPQNREDIVTIKRLKDQKQNVEQFDKHNKSRGLNKRGARNSDTLLFKKGFCIKPTIFKQENEKRTIKSSKFIQKESLRNSQVQSQAQENVTQNSHHTVSRKQLQNEMVSNRQKPQTHSTKLIQQGIKNHSVPFRGSMDSQNLQKAFKKVAKKTLIKHSAPQNKRQSFL